MCICARLTGYTRMNGKNHIHITERVEGTPRYWLYLNGFNAPTVSSTAHRPEPPFLSFPISLSLSSFFFSLFLYFPSSSVVKHSSFTVSNRVTIDVNPALGRLKQAVDKKQVCRVRQGAQLRGCSNDG